MGYTFDTTLDLPFDSAVDKVTEALAAEGFGVLTTIDVKATLKQKIDADFRPYTILGACNPGLAHKALSAEARIGVMLPCNVVVQEEAPGRTLVSAVDPVASMSAVDNPDLGGIAGEVRARLKSVIDGL